MEVSVVWLGLAITIIALFFLLTQAKGVYDAFKNYDESVQMKVQEGFIASRQDDIRLTSCPADYKQFINNEGQILCCDGTPNSGKCSGKTLCSLSEAGGGMPTCSAWYTALLDERGRNKCPPSMPNYFESKDGKLKGCTSGRRKPDGSGPLESTMKFCKLYTSQRDEESKLDSCTNQMILEKSNAFSGKGFIPKYNLVSWGKDLPAVVQVAAFTGGAPINCYTNESLERFYNTTWKSNSWKNSFTTWSVDSKLNFCSILEKYKIDKTIRFEDLKYISYDGQMTVAACDTSLPSTLPMSKGSIIARNFQVSKNYRLSFNIKPKGLRGGWANILHFTSDGSNCCKLGSRSPAIWLFPNSLRLHIRIGDSRDGNWGIDVDGLQRNKESSFSLECRDKQIVVIVDGKETRATQPTERFAGNVTVFGTNPFYEAADADVINVCYRRL
jgi:hypothetical protein